MSRAERWVQRFVIFLIAAATLWFIVTQLFDRLDRRVPVFAALIVTYLVAAYVLLPLVVRGTLSLLAGNRIPRVTRAADGLPADPVNVVLIGSLDDLKAAFAAAGWHGADPLTLRSGARMAASFVMNRPYETAPFSALYLFGRRQDLGFQEDVGSSPRERHHIRFWAGDADPEGSIADLAYWTARRRARPAGSSIWVGAGTTDTGFGLQALTYQVSHSVDRHADRERDHVVAALRAAERIIDESYIDAGAPVGSRFISDGRIFRARLVAAAGKGEEHRD